MTAWLRDGSLIFLDRRVHSEMRFAAPGPLVLFGEHKWTFGDVKSGSYCLRVLAAHVLAIDHDCSPMPPIERFYTMRAISRVVISSHGAIAMLTLLVDSQSRQHFKRADPCSEGVRR